MTRHVARAVTGMATVGITVAAAAVAAAATAGPPAAQQHASAQVTYNCMLPDGLAGSVPVPVTVAATFPAKVKSGQPVQPASARLTIHLPSALVVSLGQGHATTLSGAARLSLTVAQGASHARAAWAGLTWPTAALPASGGLTLTASGPVPAVQPRTTSPVTFTLDGLTLSMAPHAPAGTSASSSAQPSTLGCTPAAGQKLLLTTVGGHKNKKAVTAAKHKPVCPKQPKGGYKMNPRFKAPPIPKHQHIIVHHEPGFLGCAWVAGYANVRKLNGASFLGPAMVAVHAGIILDYNYQHSKYFQQDSAAELDYQFCTRTGHKHKLKCVTKHGLPPTQATFLAFGFMPATATMHLDEIGTLDLFGVGTISALQNNFSWAYLRLTISNVKVNGVPLNVGPHCQAVHPVTVELDGRAPAYSLQLGGPLDGQVNIPAFKDCGVGENLDPIFGTMRRGVMVGSISGPRNFSILTQGTLCTPDQDPGCRPRKRKPIH